MISCSSFFAYSLLIHAARKNSSVSSIDRLSAISSSRSISRRKYALHSSFILPELLHSRFERPGDLDRRHHVRQPPALHLADRCLPASHLSRQPPLAHAEVFSVFFHFVSHFVLSPYHKVSALCAFWPEISPLSPFSGLSHFYMVYCTQPAARIACHIAAKI